MQSLDDFLVEDKAKGDYRLNRAAFTDPELFELELPPHDASVAIAAPHATTVNAASRDFMAALLVPSKGHNAE